MYTTVDDGAAIECLSACSEPQSRFYATQVALGLEYMQYMDLVYRDLKPENILINVNGYLKVMDLSLWSHSLIIMCTVIRELYTRVPVPCYRAVYLSN